MDITYEAILHLYQEFFSEHLNLGQFTTALKVLAIAFFVINVWTNMFSRMGTAIGRAQLPFDERKLLSSLFIVLAIAFYDKLLDFLDTLLLTFDTTYSHFSPTYVLPAEEEIESTEGSFIDTGAKLKEAATQFLLIAKDPSHLLVLLLEGISWIIDLAIYAVFLLERFFFIGLLKVLGAIAIVLSVFEKFRDLAYKWLKLYIAVYLLIIPFFLIVGFGGFVFDFFDKAIGYNSPENFLLGSKVRVMVLAIMIWLKLRLFKKSYDLVYKIFT